MTSPEPGIILMEVLLILFHYRLEGNYLEQKQSNFDLKIGREYLADTGILKLKYVKIQCRESRNRFKT